MCLCVCFCAELKLLSQTFKWPCNLFTYFSSAHYLISICIKQITYWLNIDMVMLFSRWLLCRPRSQIKQHIGMENTIATNQLLSIQRTTARTMQTAHSTLHADAVAAAYSLFNIETPQNNCFHRKVHFERVRNTPYLVTRICQSKIYSGSKIK